MARRHSRNYEAWETWPLVDGAEVADVVGEDIFRRFLDSTKAIASGTSESTGLSEDDIEFCREVASYADEIPLTIDKANGTSSGAGAQAAQDKTY